MNSVRALTKSNELKLNQKMNKDALIEMILKEKPSEVVTREFLVSVLDQKFSSLSLEFEEKFTSLQSSLDSLTEHNAHLEAVIINQQRDFDKLNSELRQNNVIITGIPDGYKWISKSSGMIDDESASDVTLENNDEKLSHVFELIGLPDVVDDVKCRKRLGKNRESGDGSSTRPLVVTFDTKETRDKVLRQSSTLRKFNLMRNVHINPDLPKLTRMENKRLRTVRYNTRKENPNASVYIRSGKVIMDGKVIDEFDLKNQLFRSSEY